VGVTAQTMDRVEALADAGVDIITIDTAHGHSQGVINMVQLVNDAYPELNLIAGNVATKEAAKALHEAGANAIKVGVGPGSICTTRVVTGVGVPQLSAIMEVAEYTNKHNIGL